MDQLREEEHYLARIQGQHFAEHINQPRGEEAESEFVLLRK